MINLSIALWIDSIRRFGLHLSMIYGIAEWQESAIYTLLKTLRFMWNNIS